MANQSVKNINCFVQQLKSDPLKVINWRSDPLEAVGLLFYIFIFFPDFQPIETRVFYFSVKPQKKATQYSVFVKKRKKGARLCCGFAVCRGDRTVDLPCVVVCMK